MGEFRMPSLGADMDEGTLLEWLVAPGDAVRKGDIVAVVDTEKSDIEVEVFEGGVVRELLVEEGTKVPVGTPLALIDTTGATTPAPPQRPAPVEAPAETAVPARAVPAAVPTRAGPARGVPTTARTAGRVLSPVVRHLAEQLHVDVRRVPGSGPSGLVTRHDVEVAATAPPVVLPGAHHRPSSPYARRLAADRGVPLGTLVGTGPGGAVLARDVPLVPRPEPAAPAPAPAPTPADRASTMRDAIARSMARSKREIPHYYLQTTVDLSAALVWLRERNEQRPVTERLLPAALLLKATALAAAEHPELNGWWEEGHRPCDSVHLGVAIALRGGGLVAPGIEAAERLTLDQLMAALRDLTARARAGRVRGSEWTGPTITVTNLGDLGVDAVWGVIHPPQLAMVGFGAVHDEVLAVDGQPAVRPVVVASLAADHRASDGIQGAAFLTRLATLLQTPEALDAPAPTPPTHGSRP